MKQVKEDILYNKFCKLRACAYLCSVKYTDYKDNEKSFHSLTELSRKQLSELFLYFEQAYDTYLALRNGA